MLSDSCETLAGVGPGLAAKLAKCGIHTIQDLILHLPFRYQDRTRITPIQDLRPNDCCVVTGRICKVELKRGKRNTLHCHLEDKTGLLIVRFFHFNAQQLKTFSSYPTLIAFGDIRQSGHRLEMIHPEYKLLDTAEKHQVEENLTPIYSSTQGLSQTRLRQLIKQAIYSHQTELETIEWLNDAQRQEYNVYSFYKAIHLLHYPPPSLPLDFLENGTHPALQRLAFEELLAQRLSLHIARANRAALLAPALSRPSTLIDRFLSHLPFKLTAAQSRAFSDIQHDLNQSKPMLRLVQGDVGAGKTVIAALAALKAIANGYQVALMAPTEVLSEQHFGNFSTWFHPLDVVVQKLSGTMKTKERHASLTRLKNNQCHLLIGTHALFQETVQFAKLGLIIIDEQHRFGVEQRRLLQQKRENEKKHPHQLLMTATPIPRTLAMTHFAHLDISTINERPPGRTPVTTAVLHQDKRQIIITRLANAIQQGRQAYWVCTLIEESEKLQCMAATDTAQCLQAQLPSIRIGLLHGRMHPLEKEKTMLAFKEHRIDLLVATTVIEVGVDVPNASLMIIENAERLGLSQLHQLRGRIGRGHVQSHCLLLYQRPLSTLSQERLRVMRTTEDGFVIAEKDLQLRGPGDILSTRQTGYRSYKIADLQQHYAWFSSLDNIAKHLLKKEVNLAQTIKKRWLGNVEDFLQT